MRKILVLFLITLPIIMSCETHVNVNPSPEPTAIPGTPTPPVTLTPEPTPVPTVTPSPAESVTPIIETNMQEVVIESPKSTLPPEKLEVYGISSVIGEVFDLNKNPISDVSISLKKSDRHNPTFTDHDYYKVLQTDKHGKYSISAPETMVVIVTAKKEGFTERAIETLVQEGGRQKSPVDFILSITPEINELKVNNNNINVYSFSRELIERYQNKQLYKYQNSVRFISPNIELPRFKLKSVNNLKIGLNFNRVINKKSLEENIFIESLDKSIFYSNKTKSLTFEWSDNDKKVIFQVPLETKAEDTIYRLGFKEPFMDVTDNKAITGEYFS